MTIWAWCALAPLIASVLIVLRRRSWGRLLFLLLLIAVVIVWLVAPRSPCAERIVLVIENGEQAAIASSMWAGASTPLSTYECALVTMDSSDAGEPRSLTWSSDCSSLSREGAPRVATPTSALKLVERDVLDIGRIKRFYNWIVARRTRMVFLVSDPDSWKNTHWSLDLTAEVAALHSVGIGVDVVETAKTQSIGARPSLRIQPRRPFVPAIGEQADRYSFDLEIDGQPDREVVRAVDRACTLDGGCIDGQDCTSGQCSAGRCGTTQGGPATWTLKHDLVDVEPDPQTHDGLRVKTPILLSSFRSTFPNLQEGWHELHCRVRYSTPGRDNTQLDATIYVPARLAQGIVVQGAGARMWLGKAPSIDQQEPALHHAIQDHVIAHTKSIADVLIPGQSVFEDTSKTPPPTPCPDRSQCEQAGLLVVNDATTSFWKRYCPWIIGRVEAGMNLILSMAPPDLAECTRLPVFAKTNNGEPSGWFDRRPKVTFVLDPSRLGHLNYAATPDVAPFGQLSSLADGFDAQLDIVGAVITADGHHAFDRDTGEITTKREAFRRYEIADLGIAWSAYRVAGADDGQKEMIKSSQISDRLASWRAKQPAGDRFGIDDTVIIFAYNVDQRGAAGARIADVLATGAHVIVVPLESPFMHASVEDGVHAQLTPRAAGPFARGNQMLEHRIEVLSPILLAAIGTGVTGAVSAIQNSLQARERGGLMKIQVKALGRFIDERVVTDGHSDPITFPVLVDAGAPLRFQLLEHRAGRPAVELMRIVDDPKLADPKQSLDPIPIGYGALLGRGHVLVLGYSLFEGALERLPFDVPWATDKRARLVVDAEPDIWGPRRILDLGWLTSRLDPLPSERPRVVAIEALADNALVFTVRQLMTNRGSFDSVYIKPAGDDTTARDCSRNDRSVDLVLRSLRPEQQLVTLELPLSGWQRLCDGRACNVTLCRQSCTGTECGTAIASDDTILLGPLHARSKVVFDDVQPLEQIRLLASYTGGTARGGLRPLQRSNRPIAILSVAVLMSLLWLRRLLRRIGVARTRSAEEPSGETFANARGYLREVGEALGIPSSDAAAGAVAGLRPVDPGDKLRAALRQDLILMSGVVGDELAGNLRILPRIDDRTRRILLVVNAGRSMRLPSLAKLHAAALVCEVVSEIVWMARGEVRIALAGGTFPADTTALAPGGPSAADAILVGARHLEWVARVPEHLVEPGDTVIYVSDYLNEDLSELARIVEDVESEGGVLGFVRVVSPSEARLIDFGIHPPTGVVFDRSDWTGAELLREYRRFGTELDALLDHASAGVTHVSSTTEVADIITIVRTSRLMAFLR